MLPGGQYFRAKNIEALQKIYAELDKIEPIEKDAETFRPLTTLFYWPLGLAFVISIIWACLAALSGALPNNPPATAQKK